ncbi:MAG: phosphatase PAP2 family protein [Kiritimatiellia bacterium]
MVQWLIETDHAIFFFLNRMAAWTPLMELAAWLSALGRYPILLFALIPLTLRGWSRFYPHLLAMLIVLPFAFGVNYGLKDAVRRFRPMGYYERVPNPVPVTIQYRERMTRRSFPSGHTTMAFFAMGYLVFARRRHAFWAFPLAVGVAWSRVAVGAHFPVDCAAGALLGSIWALLAWRIHCFWESRSCNQPQRPIPGPGPSSGCCSGC